MFTSHQLIANYQSPSGGYVFDVVTTTVFPNGTVLIVATDIPAPDPNSAPAFYSEQFSCQIGRGAKFYAPKEMPQPAVAWPAVLKSMRSGASFRLVWRDAFCKSSHGVVSGSPASSAAHGMRVTPTEAFFDKDFGPPELSAVSSQLIQNKTSSQWILVQQVARLLPSSSVLSLTSTALDPASLKPVGINNGLSESVMTCPWPSDTHPAPSLLVAS